MGGAGGAVGALVIFALDSSAVCVAPGVMYRGHGGPLVTLF